MPARKSREAKSTAPSPSPSTTRASGRTRGKKAVEIAVQEEAVDGDEQEEEGAESAVTADAVEAEEVDGGRADDHPNDEEDLNVDGSAEADEVASGVELPISEVEPAKRLSTEDRLAKIKDLRQRMNQSTQANRRDLVEDHQKSKVTAKELQRLEKQRKLAQTLRLKADAEANGEDLDRKKNWEWSIEQNERWEKKLEEQVVRGDSSFHNAEDAAHKAYNRNIRSTKADLLAYERQKEQALGLAPGTLVPIGSTSQSLLLGGPSRAVVTGLSAAEDLYRGADTLAYGDSKPSEDAIDRVVGKINKDMDKGKRKKKVEEDGEVTYINDRNKVFNKKIGRYFDKYTKEIRANFERGTAL